MATKYGSFKVKINTEEGPKEYTVNPPTQNQLAEGWFLVLPKTRTRRVKHKNEDGTVTYKRKSNQKYFKVNLAELPSHLFYKLKPIYKDGSLSHYKVSDRCYTYLVQPSPVDNIIEKLYTFTEKHVPGFVYKQETYDHYRELLNTVKENDISGWVVFKSQHILN